MTVLSGMPLCVLATLQMAAACMPAAMAPNAQTAEPRIAFVLDGKVVTQPAGGGKVVSANAIQQKQWRARSRAVLSAVSPDGKYRVVPVPGAKLRGETPFRVVRRSNGEDMFVSFGPGLSIDGDLMAFDGWLDSGHLAVWLDGMSPNGGCAARRVVGVPEGDNTTFNGWLGPGGRTAIVLEAGGEGREPGLAIERFRFFMDPKPGVEEAPSIPYLAVSSPVRIRSFRLDRARTVSLTLDGKPFAGVGLPAPDYIGDRLRRRPTVEFSRDGLWALMHRCVVRDRKKQGIEYVVYIKTGVVRLLPGTEAVFL